ncbi:NAD(P)-dependent alcohol dehydrogenase [bacterium]|nr:NAD(P)-dependent alcohol dehydrogenase [bacterium]
MKAFYSRKYGDPQHLKIEEHEIPAPKKDEVLVRVLHTTINDFDYSLVTGKPKIYRLIFGLPKPRRPIPGMELSGEVISVGEAVKNFKKGDSVYGDISEKGWGTFTEYACVNEKALRIKPDYISSETAAATPHAAMLAFQGLVRVGKLKEKSNILVNGAGGGMGTFAIQIAKQYGCTITAVDHGDKLEKLRELGADEVIDYTKTDFTKTGERYDLIIDAKSTRSPWAYARALKKNGKFVTVGGTPGVLIRILISKGFVKLITGKSLSILALKPNEDLDKIEEMYKANTLKPLIDGPHEFEKIPELIDYFGKGKHFGKIVVEV